MAIGLFVLLTILTAVSLLNQTQEAVIHPRLASFSNQPDGARALWLWLDEIGYRVGDQVGSEYEIPVTAKLVLLLEPSTLIQDDEWQKIDAWVKRGNTLLFVGSETPSFLGMQHFNVTIRYATVQTATLQLPLLDSPPITETFAAQTIGYLQTNRSDIAVHVSDGERPLVISFRHGLGRVILSTLAYSFTNQGLNEPHNAQLALNLVNAAPLGQLVWFDEWHHGVRPEAAGIGGGPGEWLRNTPTGQSLLYVFVVIFLALVLRGRLFGRPVPLAEDTARRAPVEYITAVANLGRRAGHKTAVLQDYHFRLKRDLGRRYRLNPTLPDEQFIQQLTQLNPNLDTAALRNLLHRLSQSTINEATLVHLAAEVADWLKK